MTTKLVCFVGTSEYNPVVYEIDGRQSSEVRLFPAAIVDLCGEIDDIAVIATKEARDVWFGSDNRFDTRVGKQGRKVPQARKVPEEEEGLNYRDPWAIFDVVAHELGAFGDSNLPDEIIFDVTHAFRSLPVIGAAAAAFTISEWARKGLTHRPNLRILYGAFEAKNKNNVVPVWDLTPLVEATQWNAALDALMRYGRADDLAMLAREASKRSVAAAAARGVTGRELGPEAFLKRLGEQAQLYADDLATGRMHAVLTSSAAKLLKTVSSPEAQDWAKRLPVIRGARRALEEQLQPLRADKVLSPEGLKAQAALAAVYARLQRYAEHAACLREMLVTRFGHMWGQTEPPEPGQQGCHQRRMQVERALGQKATELRESGPREDWSLPMRDVLNVANPMQQVRNDVEHLGLNDHPGTSKAIRTSLEELHSAVQKAIVNDVTRTRFLNLSNHSVSGWSDEQLQAARKLGFGEPVDLDEKMPEIDPQASCRTISEQAKHVADRAIKQGAAGAFVASDYTFTFELVRELQRRGVRCFAATTNRETQERLREDGAVERKIVYRFVQWREYGWED